MIPSYREWPVYATCYLIGAGTIAAFELLGEFGGTGVVEVLAVFAIAIVGMLAMLHVGAAHERGELL